MSRAAVAQVSFTRGSSIRCHFWRWWLKYSFAQVAQILVSTWLRFSLTFTIRDYRRTKAIYNQFRESGWSAKFYQEHRAEIEAHKKAQAVYELHDGKLPTLKELTAEYVALKGQLDAYKPDLAELKSKLTDLKHIRYNYKILIRDTPQTDQYHRKGDRIER